MITVTRLKGGVFAVNPDLVERVHETPDTTLVMVDGSTYIVSESLSEVIDRIAEYRARVISLAYKLVSAPTDSAPTATNREDSDETKHTYSEAHEEVAPSWIQQP